jgi:hypothetical protein
MHHGLLRAEGWLELGNVDEAAVELHNLPSEVKSSVEVLRLWVRVYALGKAWNDLEVMCDLLLHHSPGDTIGVLHKAEVLHRQGRSADAVIFLGDNKGALGSEGYYNLARYLCANGQKSDAVNMLGFAVNQDKELRMKALNDPDLEPIWTAMQKSR